MIEVWDVVARANAVLSAEGAATPIQPETAQEVADVLEESTAAQRSVIPWGGGTEQDLGAPPLRCDVLLGTQCLSGILAYAPEDLTLSVRAGTTLAEIGAVLMEHGQFLPLDLPQPERATIGGVIATAAVPVRRLRYGGLRDMVIGLEVALPDGSLCKSGGRVVKNVAGYDLCKLFTGSLGTLGVVVSANLKVQPLPRRRSLLTGTFSSRAAALLAADELAAASQGAGALIVSHDPAARYCTLDVLAEGLSGAVTRQIEAARAACEHYGGDANASPDPDASDACLSRLLEWRAATRDDRSCLVRGSVAPAQLAPVLDALLAAFNASGCTSRVQADAAMGTFFVQVSQPPDMDDVLASTFCDARASVTAFGGHLVLAGGSVALRRAVDVWGAPEGGAHLARILKAQIDPAGVLNPGRFAYGI